MRKPLLSMLLTVGLAFAVTVNAVAEDAMRPTATTRGPLPLHVAGNKLMTASGERIVLRGVNIPSLEWSAGGDNILRSIGVAIGDWHANVVRLPLSQDRWFGRARSRRTAARSIAIWSRRRSRRFRSGAATRLWICIGRTWAGGASTSVNTKCPTPKVASSGRTPRRCSRTIRP